jgi:hypothetical protein
MSRGRTENTTYVNTQYVPDDAATGTVNQTARQDPLGVLAGTAERADPDLAATVHAEQDAAEAASLRTIAERFADAAELATAGRTATMLDRLVHDDTLSPAQRAILAADEGTVSLSHVLRQAEIAGHDPDRVLRDAIASRDLGDARSLASVIHHRIAETVDLHPVGDRYADWVPKVDDPDWQRHLSQLAELADSRQRELGEQIAETRPQWAIKTLGPVPDDEAARNGWAKRASAVAAHRELTGHDDASIALPGPPKQGQVEAYASWRAGWRALGRDEASRAEAEMSDGQLRVRVRAYQREEAWAPDYVAPELSGTIQAAQRHHATAELRAAEAEHQTDAEQLAQLQREATEARALAEVLDQRAAQLEHADETRAYWYAHTANTRGAEQRARDELGARGINPDQHADITTADHWLTAHRGDQAVEDRHRQITDEYDLADVAQQRDADHRAVEPAPSADAAETAVADIREHGMDEPERAPRADDDWTRVPTADETADSITRAQRALAELEARHAEEQRRAAEEARSDQLSRWHANDLAAANATERRIELDRAI